MVSLVKADLPKIRRGGPRQAMLNEIVEFVSQPENEGSYFRIEEEFKTGGLVSTINKEYGDQGIKAKSFSRDNDEGEKVFDIYVALNPTDEDADSE